MTAPILRYPLLVRERAFDPQLLPVGSGHQATLPRRASAAAVLYFRLPALPPQGRQSPARSASLLGATSGRALPISEIGILQEQGSEFLVGGHHLPNVILDFEAGMYHGPIMSSSDKGEKREQILKAFAAQCLPQCLLGALGL